MSDPAVNSPRLSANRPVWYNLSPTNLPLPGIVSILHRISGILLVMALIWGLYLLDLSLASEAGFRHLSEYLAHPLAKLGALIMAWAFFHHLCAGIRYLALDLDIGVDLAPARASSYWVFCGGIVLTLLMGWKIW